MRKITLLAFLILLGGWRAEAQNQTVAGNLVAASSACNTRVTSSTPNCIVINLPNAAGAVSVSLSGTFSATVQFEAAGADGVYHALLMTPSSSSTQASSATGAGLWTINVAGMSNVRVRCSAYTSGTVVATINPSLTASMSGGGGGGGGGGDTITSPNSTLNVGGTSSNTSLDLAGAAGEIMAGSTPALTPTPALGTDNSTAGTLQLANGSANAHTIWASAATTTNTIQGFATAPVTGDLIECVTTSTKCLLTDTGVLASAILSNPMTTLGDMIDGGSSGTPTRLAGYSTIVGVPAVLTSTATSGPTAATPAWQLAGVPVNNNSETTCASINLNILDRATFLDCSGTTTSTITIPVHSTSGWGSNYPINICNYNSGVMTLTPTTDSIDNGTLQAGWCSLTYNNSSGNWVTAQFPTWDLFSGLGTGILGNTTSTGKIAIITAIPSAVTATTQTTCDNSTKIATTAYAGETCQTVESSGSPLSASAQAQTIWNNTSGAYVVDLPTPAASGPPICLGNYKAIAHAVSFVPGTGVTIYYKGSAGTSGSSTGLVSGGAAGDYICVQGTDSTTYEAIGAGQGTWTNN